MFADRLFGHAAELGFYFFFALFPALFCASSLLGLAARSANQIYDRLLDYLAFVIPTSALGTILDTFNQTAAASTSGKLTFGLLASVWSASVGISAVQDSLNAVYKVKSKRSFLSARLHAILLTILLTAIVTTGLASLLGANFAARFVYRHIQGAFLASFAAAGARLAGWIVALALLSLCFAFLYRWAPDRKMRRWQWFTPGCAISALGWVVSSLGLRVYIRYFNSYSVVYGSLGAVIILLTWFYTTGLMLLLGAEINNEIEAAAAERKAAAALSAASDTKLNPPL
jgi:membrane protein